MTYGGLAATGLPANQEHFGPSDDELDRCVTALDDALREVMRTGEPPRPATPHDAH